LVSAIRAGKSIVGHILEETVGVETVAAVGGEAVVNSVKDFKANRAICVHFLLAKGVTYIFMLLLIYKIGVQFYDEYNKIFVKNRYKGI
jgi:hypothetical protein